MSAATLEHVNLTVPDAKKTAETLAKLFDWRIRWEGGSIYDGYSVHVGDETSYLALYTPPRPPEAGPQTHFVVKGLNHVGLTVGDLDAAEARVEAAGYAPRNHADYEPGRRFYFHDHDGIEWEVVSYT